MKKKSTILLLISVLVIALLAYIGMNGLIIGDYQVKPFSQMIRRGLDLQGGVSVVEEIQANNVSQDTMNRTIQLLELRVNKLGVSEPVVTQEGNKRIRIDVPGTFDPQSVVDTIGKTGQLKFVGPDNQTILTGADVKDASPYMDPTNGPSISLSLTSSGAQKFADATQKFLGQQISIYMDTDLVSSPKVDAVISDGKASINNMQSIDEATREANIIKSGALPVTLKTASVEQVGATLGASALPRSVLAGEVGIGLVLLFMLLVYRIPGLMADIALILYIVLVLLVFTGINATLTLSGIAAFLLTVGMAVDANVLMFERMKEEIRVGKTPKTALQSGYEKALSSILDSNTTTAIAGVVLYLFGSGTVKGFGLTLLIGIVVSLFTAIVVTRFLLKQAVNMGLLNKLSHFGVKERG